MKRFYMTLMLVLFVCAGASAEFKNGYYDKMNGKSGAAQGGCQGVCAHTSDSCIFRSADILAVFGCLSRTC